jgi:hypothetical protein
MAQEAFAKDWIAAYQRYYQKAVSLPAHSCVTASLTSDGHHFEARVKACVSHRQSEAWA